MGILENRPLDLVNIVAFFVFVSGQAAGNLKRAVALQRHSVEAQTSTK